MARAPAWAMGAGTASICAGWGRWALAILRGLAVVGIALALHHLMHTFRDGIRDGWRDEAIRRGSLGRRATSPHCPSRACSCVALAPGAVANGGAPGPRLALSIARGGARPAAAPTLPCRVDRLEHLRNTSCTARCGQLCAQKGGARCACTRSARALDGGATRRGSLTCKEHVRGLGC